MRRILIFASVSMLSLSALGQPAVAAGVNDVLGACDRTPGCSYSQNKNGDISGCSAHACFYCAADGKRQCVGASKGSAARTGGGAKGGAIDIGGVKLQRGTVPARASDAVTGKTAPKLTTTTRGDNGRKSAPKSTPADDKLKAAHGNKATTAVDRSRSNDKVMHSQQSGGSSGKKH